MKNFIEVTVYDIKDGGVKSSISKLLININNICYVQKTTFEDCIVETSIKLINNEWIHCKESYQKIQDMLK